MPTNKVLVIATGTANIASMLAALQRLGQNPVPTSSAKDVVAADCVVLPGVGAFAAAKANLDQHQLGEALQQRVAEEKKTLAICLGMQLLCESSEESPGCAGLGIVKQRVQRFPDTVRVPQLGWNKVMPDPDCRILSEGYAYFANSYYLPAAQSPWCKATTSHGISFVSAIENGPVLACQFHPELSGDWGMQTLDNWIQS